MNDCQFCDLLANNAVIGGNDLYSMVISDNIFYAIWNDHISLQQFPYCTSKLTTMKIDSLLKAEKHFGHKNINSKFKNDGHIAYIFRG